MINKKELIKLMSDLESDRVERTISVSKKDKFGEVICAYANDLPNHGQPGYLIIGVNDDGSLSKLEVTDDILKNLGAIRSDGNVLPQPVINVSKFSMEGGEVAVVEVLPSDLPPVRYKGRVHIRIGPRKAIANEQEERILSERRIALARSFDARPCPETSIHDMAMGQFDTYKREAIDEEIIETNHRPVEQQLASLRLYNTKRTCLTHAGVLLVGKNPRFYLPGAYIQYLKLSHPEFTDIPEDQAEISGDLHSLLRELEVRVKSIIKTTMRSVSSLQEKNLPNYPEWALRELLMNAVMHRNYDSNAPIRFYVFSNRIEIYSPGGLYGDATPENFPSRNSYRNPVIAEAMKSLGFVNRFGYGVRRAQTLLQQNGNPPPKFEFDEHAVLVKINQRDA